MSLKDGDFFRSEVTLFPQKLEDGANVKILKNTYEYIDESKGIYEYFKPKIKIVYPKWGGECSPSTLKGSKKLFQNAFSLHFYSKYAAFMNTILGEYNEKESL